MNAGGFSSLELSITEKGTTTTTNACVVREIAFDGVYLNMVRSQYRGQSFLTVGARVDWMVYCTVAGRYEVNRYEVYCGQSLKTLQQIL